MKMALVYLVFCIIAGFGVLPLMPFTRKGLIGVISILVIAVAWLAIIIYKVFNM